MRRNRVLERLRKEDFVVMPVIWAVPHWKIVEVLGLLGFECVWVEMEHSDFTLEQLSEMILAGRATGMEVMVRVRRGSYNDVIAPLEAGAAGLLLPHCTGSEDAREFVRMAKFQPLGLRGIGGGADRRYGLTSFDEYIEEGNRETFLAVMIERREAVEQVEAIAATKGIDVLFVGPADLSQSYGILGQWEHPLIQEAIERVAVVCKAHGKWWGMPCSSPEELRRLIDKGARFFSISSELDVLMSGLKQLMEQFQIQIGRR